MNLWPWRKKPEQRSEDEEESPPLTLSSKDGWLSGDAPYSPATALRVSAVLACAKVIAETVATLPLHLYRASGKGDEERERVSNHSLAALLSESPNEAMTWSELRESVLLHQVLSGNGYAEVFWSRRGQVESIETIPSQLVTPKRTASRSLVYDVLPGFQADRRRTLSMPNIAHFKGLTLDGLVGISPIEAARNAYQNAQMLGDALNEGMCNGVSIRGVLEHPGTFKDKDTAERVRNSWESAYSGPRGRKVAILEQGMRYSPVVVNMRDLQFIEAQQMSVVEIARIFRVPPHKIQHLDKATYSNIEHQGVEFYRDTILPWLVRWEQVLNRTLLTAGDRAQGYYLAHNPEGVLRGDFAARMDGYTKAIGNGIMTVNEVRRKENLPPSEDGDDLFMPVNLARLNALPTHPKKEDENEPAE